MFFSSSDKVLNSGGYSEAKAKLDFVWRSDFFALLCSARAYMLCSFLLRSSLLRSCLLRSIANAPFV